MQVKTKQALSWQFPSNWNFCPCTALTVTISNWRQITKRWNNSIAYFQHPIVDITAVWKASPSAPWAPEPTEHARKAAKTIVDITCEKTRFCSPAGIVPQERWLPSAYGSWNPLQNYWHYFTLKKYFYCIHRPGLISTKSTVKFTKWDALTLPLF